MGSKARGGLSKREWERANPGQTAPSDSKSSSSMSSKDQRKFKEAMKDNGSWDSFQRLSPEQQEFTQYNWKTIRSDSKEKAKLLEESLKEATKQADPYWQGFLKIAQDEIGRSFDDAKNTFQYQKDELEIKIQNIAEDLATNKEFYSLEQQSDLAKLKQSYEQQVGQVIEDAANKGVTFSTKRTVPLQQLEEYNKNVVESTQRQYEKQLGDIETEAGRGTGRAEREIKQRREDLQSSLTGIGRSAEERLGTENLPKLEGYKALGDVSGQFYEDKVADIEQRKQGIFDEKSFSSLTF